MHYHRGQTAAKKGTRRIECLKKKECLFLKIWKYTMRDLHEVAYFLGEHVGLIFAKAFHQT